MSIHFISGKPGGGKSLYALKLLEEELVHGSRPCFTNLPILPGRLNEYLQTKYPDKSIDLHSRLRLLSDDEAARFWCYRPGCVVGVLSKAQWESGVRPDYSGVTDKGVFYAIDEIHNYFNSRAWMETGRDVLFYLSQHRKLGDTVLCITQAIGNVDKQFRSVAQDYTYLRNLSKERMGLFRMPSIFTRKTFLSPATDTSKPMESGTFRLYPEELPSCYETAKGVGIHGRGADLSERKKGIHWVVPLILVPLLLLALWKFGPMGVVHFFKISDKVASVASASASPTPAINPPVPARSPAPERVPVASAPLPSRAEVVPDARPVLYLTGLVQPLNGPATVYLSDGRVLRWGDTALEIIGRDWVQVEGVKLRYKH